MEGFVKVEAGANLAEGPESCYKRHCHRRQHLYRIFSSLTDRGAVSAGERATRRAAIRESFSISSQGRRPYAGVRRVRPW
jgi:hypothetical protein